MFRGSRQEYHVKDLLQNVCKLAYIFNFKDRHSEDLKIAKINLFNTCTSLKLPIKNLSFYTPIKTVTKTHITVEGYQIPLNVPEKLKTLIVVDFGQKIKDTDVLYLVEKSIQLAKLFIWLTQKEEEEELHMISYPSEVFNCWLNPSEIMAVHLYRKTN
ncbi:hypothetical protein BSL78_17042, partial [Apostichopus japonicus]